MPPSAAAVRSLEDDGIATVWAVPIAIVLRKGGNAEDVRRAVIAAGCGRNEARSIAHSLRARGHFRSGNTTTGCRSVDGVTMLPPDAPPLPVPIDPYIERARANILHLLDLKRAGHSPRRTELVMKREGRVHG